MKTDKIVESDLFEKPRRYLVPIFQRGYVWSKEAQWAPLWEDIINLVDSILSKRKTNSINFRKHFLGTIVIQQQTLGVRHIPASDVIDGQQRLVTLQLVLIALRDILSKLESEFLNATLDRLTHNPGPYVTDNERFKVWPTSVYCEEFTKLALAGSAELVQKIFPRVRQRRTLLPRPQLVEAYLFFCEQIEQYLKNGRSISDENNDEQTTSEKSTETKIQLAETLMEAITRQVQLVEISLDTEDDPQIIFETLNARGVPLSASDLIRNFIFLYATRHQESVIELYEHYWKSFDETPDDSGRSRTKRFWREEERQGRFKTNRLDLFFYHYITYQTALDLKIGHIFQEFKDWWEKNEVPRSAKNELSAISTASDTYHKLITPRNDTKFGRFASVLRTLDTATVYPVILFLESHQSNSENIEKDGIYQDIESYLMRRSICGLTKKGYNNLFLSLLKEIKSQDSLLRSSVQRYLLSLEGESRYWPDDDVFKQHFMYDPLYNILRSAQIQMILESIERGLSTPFQESFELNTSLSIEHVWPRNPAEGEWPSYPKNENGSIDVLSFRNRYDRINSIGNLTLVTPSFNSSLSNRSFQIKQPAIVRESRLRLNTYFQDLHLEAWSEEEIFKRGEALFELAKKIWSRPQWS